MRSWVQVIWAPLLALVVLASLGAPGEPGAALWGGGSPDVAAAPLDQADQPPLCAPPRRVEQVPERAAEMRLARDADGALWQIQSGCRHLVEPYYMDTATLSAIPQGEDASFVSYGFPAPVPTPSGLTLPAYARLPIGGLLGQAAPAPAEASAPESGASPGTLDRYQSRVLVIDPANPNVVYLLQGGMRHRVLIYYPLDVVLATIDPSRAGDLGSYALRGPEGYVGTITDVPWGEPAPLVGWGTGESVVISDRPASPDAVNCAQINATPTAGPVFTGQQVGVPTAVVPRRSQIACERFREAQEVSAGAYISNPGQYAGRDLRLVFGTACSVRYNAARDGKSFQYTVGDSAVAAFAPGPEVQRDAQFTSYRTVDIGTFVSTVTETSGASTSGELIVFAYVVRGGGSCPQANR
ncbi:MAG TPA: hypothetical protein VII06_13410 [Chloroflexota bacterium]